MAIEQADFDVINSLRNNSTAVCAILGDCTFHCFTNKQEFEDAANFSRVDTFDLNGSPTYKLDLNEPVPDTYHAQYDWVIDSGTSFCCFDIATVFSNIVKMVKIGGYVFHAVNLTGFFGRGYFSLSPALFSEFYPINGFELVKLATHTKKYRTHWLDTAPGENYLRLADETQMRFSDDPRMDFIPLIPNDTMICCVARKIADVPFKKPVPQHFTNTSGR